MSQGIDILSDEEKKFFDTRGKYEPEGYSDAPIGDKEQDEQIATGGAGESPASEGFNESLSETSATEAEESRVLDAPTSDGHPETTSNKSSTRDYEKAYGIAESKRVELARQVTQMQEQMRALMQQQQQMQQQPRGDAKPEVIPDPTDDPLGYQAYQLEKLNQTVSAQQKYFEEQTKREAERSQMQQLLGMYQASAVEFAKEVPDFQSAYNFLEKSRINEYTAAGYTQAEAARMLQEDEIALAAKALRERANPAERIYAMAKARGFAGVNPSPSAPPKLESVAKGIEKSKTLPRAGGKNIERGYDMSNIDELSDSEFDKLFNQLKAEAKKTGNYKKDFY